MRKIKAVFMKQIWDTLKNKAVFLQFILFPFMAVIFTASVKIEDVAPNFFVTLFAAMYVGMAPLVVMSEILSEEKGSNTLRVLFMSDVKPWQYLIGVGGYILIICTLGAVVFSLTGGYTGWAFLEFLVVMVIGILISELLGAAIGMWSRNQVAASSVSVPVMVTFSFLPMLAEFNESVRKVSVWTYSQQVKNWLANIGTADVGGKMLAILAVNMLIAGIFFIAAYKKQED